MGHPRQGYRRHTGQCRQRFAIDMDGGRDIFACRSVSERIRPYLFPFGFLPPKLWDIKPRGNGKPWAMEPAVEDTDGRSASDRTRPRFFFFGLCSTRSPPYRGTGFRYRIRLLPGLACGILPDGTIPWR